MCLITLVWAFAVHILQIRFLGRVSFRKEAHGAAWQVYFGKEIINSEPLLHYCGGLIKLISLSPASQANVTCLPQLQRHSTVLCRFY